MILEARFADERPPLDVVYEMESRVRRLLPLDPNASGLVFRGAAPGNAIELHLEAADETHNVYLLRLEATTINATAQANFSRWMAGLATAAAVQGSPERYSRLMAEAIAGEAARGNPGPEDAAAIARIQQAMLAGLGRGKSFGTVSKEGGTNIRWAGDRFVMQDFGDSEERKEFTGPAAFLGALRQFYDRRAWWEFHPHRASETQIWQYIAGQLR
jgi:hypothetical protein